MRKLLITLAIATAITLISLAAFAATSPLQGGMTANQASDTTYTFSPPLENGVTLVNPDALCEFLITFEGSTSQYIRLPGNTSVFIDGWIATVRVGPSTTQFVGVYGTN